MNVRPIQSNDIPRCAELFAAAFVCAPWSEAWSIADATARLDEVYRTPGAYGVVAEDDATLVGFALGYTEQLNREQHFYLKEMAVAPERQHEGVGTAMLEALCRALAAMGITVIYLLTLRDSPAQAFYEKSGFQVNSGMVVMGKRLQRGMCMIAKRAQEITPFLVMDVLERACAMEREGIDVIHLEVGEPDFDTPQCVKDALWRALQEGRTHYTHSLGELALREAICRYYRETYNVAVHPDQVVVTSGTSPAMLLIFAALLEPGDEVILSDPGYACYPNFIRLVDGIPVSVPVYEEDGFQYRPEAIQERVTDRTRAILINSPSNPTGNLLSEERMRAIADLAPFIVSDEIYHGLVYEGKEHSILEFTDRAFVLNGFSKLYAMTGLRLGYLIAPREFVRPIQKMQQNLFICANSAVQMAGVAALEQATADVARMKRVYDERRRYMVKRLKELGFGITVEPTGAFYVFANAGHISNDSYRLAFDILEKAHVGVTPGIDFGRNGEGYLRFSYANSLENIVAGLDRIEGYLMR